jgi:hypothetical protein
LIIGEACEVVRRSYPGKMPPDDRREDAARS